MCECAVDNRLLCSTDRFGPERALGERTDGQLSQQRSLRVRHGGALQALHTLISVDVLMDVPGFLRGRGLIVAGITDLRSMISGIYTDSAWPAALPAALPVGKLAAPSASPTPAPSSKTREQREVNRKAEWERSTFLGLLA